MSRWTSRIALLAALLVPGSMAIPAGAEELDIGEDSGEVDEPAVEEDLDEDASAAPPAAQPAAAETDRQFDELMSRNTNASVLNGFGAGPHINNAGPHINNAIGGLAASSNGVQRGGEVEIPLGEFSRVRERLSALREDSAKDRGPMVVLGAAEYSGEARPGALALKARLHITLGHADRFKTVPLIGDDVVLVRASEGGTALPIARQGGYHVWITKKTGELEIELEVLVPARGPRGSIEYGFTVSRTPVTSFRCRFPVPGLEPRLEAAVRSEVKGDAASTQLDATLRPTTRIHLVGFKDLGDSSDARARLYTESLNLLSIEEDALDVFTVLRYTILYGGTKDFQVLIPSGMVVVSADGEGAFRYTLEKTDAGTLLRGETAFPIRNAYEVSLRLHRDLARSGASESFDAPLPRAIGVEREHGWLGVEVPGKLKLEEVQRTDVLAVDLRQLPPEMIESAVSPILKAYRYHSSKSGVRLAATRLPEKDPASASVDRIRAFTVMSGEAKLLTEMKITLRNRLRHSLTLAVAPGTSVLSTLLDGQPVKPSKDEKGLLVLPLKRSSGGERMEPFTVQVVLESEAGSMGLFGAPKLSLPAVDLPVSSLAWSVFLPAKNVYSGLRGDIAEQSYAGEASWFTSASPGSSAPVRFGSSRSTAGQPGSASAAASASGSASASADTGAMPVRIQIPEAGTRLEYARYWMESDRPVSVSFRYLRRWLLAPIGLLLGLLLAAGIVLLGNGFTGAALRRISWVGALLVLWVLLPLAKVGGTGAVIGAASVGLAITAMRHGWPRRLLERAEEWWTTLPARFRERERPEKRSWLRVAMKAGIAAGMFAIGSALLGSLIGLAMLLGSPLSG